MELNEHGLKVWRHKTNKRLFLQQSYRWKDHIVLLDEMEGRQIVDTFKASTFDYSAWVPITKEEFYMENSTSTYRVLPKAWIISIKLKLKYK